VVGEAPSPGTDGRGDAELLAAHVAGDPEAFAALVVRHRDRLWAVALRTTGDREVAADALQDALVSAHRRAGTFRGDSAVTTWLHRVVVNASLDRLRSERVRHAVPLPDDLDRLGRSPDGTPPGLTVRGSDGRAGDPAEQSLVAERRREILGALRELPAEQRAALVLVDLEGMGVAEAASVLDCPVGTVKSRCSRGRRRLALRLAHLVADGNPSPDRDVLPPGHDPDHDADHDHDHDPDRTRRQGGPR